jgi:Holliday junction resolvase RusA-like endonuclease
MGVQASNTALPHKYVIHVNPVPKPRMTKQDTWKKRPIVERYWAYKNEMVARFKLLGLSGLPGHIKLLHFTMQMPKSWSKKKRDEMNGQPHKQKPDIDNMLKGVFDCLCEEDEHIWRVDRLEKRWGRVGQIIIIV